MSRLSFLAAATGALLATGSAQAAACLTREETEQLVVFALPAIVEGAGKRCAPHLGASAYLPRSGATLAQRYRSESRVSWTSVRPAFERMAGESFPDLLSGDSAGPIMETVVAEAILAEIKPGDCRIVDRVISLLAPLPISNIGALTALLMDLGTRGDVKSAPFKICPE